MANSILAPDRLDRAEDVEPQVHHMPSGLSDRFAPGFTKLLRVCAAAAAPYPPHADEIRSHA